LPRLPSGLSRGSLSLLAMTPIGFAAVSRTVMSHHGPFHNDTGDSFELAFMAECNIGGERDRQPIRVAETGSLPVDIRNDRRNRLL
jgi:hypothetical protein